jgi:alkylated DNA repair dioxygenase AlkB
MKPAPFMYMAPRSLEEACSLLAEHGDDAKVLAGGQSLGPLMNLRLSTPGVLVDINRIPDLDGIISVGGSVRIGALARQRSAERSSVVGMDAPLVVERPCSRLVTWGSETAARSREASRTPIRPPRCLPCLPHCAAAYERWVRVAAG